MTTMTIKPYVYLGPSLTGEISHKNVYNFYKNHFIGKMLKDTMMILISYTADKCQVVDDIILSFTHYAKIDFMLPQIPPAEKYIDISHVVVMKFEDDKITLIHQWNRASLLAQIWLVNSKDLPISEIKGQRYLLIWLQKRVIMCFCQR